MRNIVVLPQPEGPSNATNSPCFSSALKSMYEAFPAAEARRLVERFEWHYTSKHCSGALRIERPPFNRVMISRAERSRGLLGDRKVYGGAFRLTSIELPRCCR
jgi:hypothetical protein